MQRSPAATRCRRGADRVGGSQSVAEGADRLSPRVPGEVDVAESPQQVSSPLVQWLQPGVFDAPLSAEPANDELAVAANGDRERAGPQADTLQQIFQSGNDGVEFGLVAGHIVAELDLP